MRRTEKFLIFKFKTKLKQLRVHKVTCSNDFDLENQKFEGMKKLKNLSYSVRHFQKVKNCEKSNKFWVVGSTEEFN